MAKQTKAQAETVERVLHEYKEGALKTSTGRKVNSRQQAVAIALSEAGESNRVDAATNKRRLATTKTRERTAERTKAELYGEARKRKLPGRSTMSKAELVRALA